MSAKYPNPPPVEARPRPPPKPPAPPGQQRGYLVDRCPKCLAWMVRVTLEQHAALQMIYQDFALQRDWPRGSGQLHGPTVWKRLIIAAWERTQGHAAEFYPAIDGAGVDAIYRRQSRLNRSEASEVIEFAKSVAAELDVVLHEPEPKQERKAA